MREDHGEILGEISMEGDPVKIGDKIGRCHMENKLRFIGDVVEKKSRGDKIFMALESSGKRSDQPCPLAPYSRCRGETLGIFK